MKVLFRLFSILKEFTGEVFLSLLLGVAAIAAGIGLLGTSAFLIASAALRPSIAELQVAIVGVRFFGISRGVFRYLERLVSHSVNLRVLTRLREEFYRQVEPGAPMNLASHRSGDMLERVMGDLQTLENFYVRVISPVVVALVISTGVSLFVGGYAIQLGLVLAIGLLMGGVIHPGISMLVSRVPIQDLARSKAAASEKLVETLQGLEDIQANNAQGGYFNSLMGKFQRSGELQQRLVTISAGGSGLSLLITNLTMLVLLWVAIPLVGEGALTGISLAVVTLVGLASFEAIIAIPAAALNLNASAIALERLFSIGKDAPAKVKTGDLTTPHLPSSVRFEKVSFAYGEESERVLEDIDLVLQAGRKVAIVGASGAGKTSLVNLLMGFGQPQSGTISINEVDLHEIDPEWSRSLFAVLPQAVYLFDDTLRGNLLLARISASDEELINVLEMVDLDGWYTSLPEGLDTWIGERGIKMSGGERQRLALARVLLQDRPFIILDEPTASLDLYTAQNVMDNLFTTLTGKGLLLITHDMELMKRMDEILVISRGRVTQRGTLDALLANKGDFRDIFEQEVNRILDS